MTEVADARIAPRVFLADVGGAVVEALSAMMSSKSCNVCARIESIAACKWRSPL